MNEVRRRVIRLLAVCAAVAVLAGACGDDGAPAEVSAPAGADSGGDDGWPHDFSAPLIGGGTFEAGDYEGQDLVLWFWAPW